MTVPSSLDRARAELGTESRPLDVAADPDPELDDVAAVAALLLVGAQLVVAGVAQALLERAQVVARVVVGAGDGLVREVGDVVAPADLGRVHAELVREQVHRPLDQCGRLRPAGAAVGADRRRVRHDRVPVEVDLRDVVDAARHQAGEHRHQAGVGRVGAAVLDHAHLQPGDLAVAGAADLDLLHLGAAVLHLQHRLRARLDVAHGTAELARQRDGHDLLGVGRDPRAEAAAGRRRDDPQLFRLDSRRTAHAALLDVRALARGPQDEAAGVRVRRGQRGARLHRHGGEPLVDEASADAHLGVRERFLAGRAGGGQVAGLGSREQLRRIVVERLGHIDERVERVEVDVDELGGVDGLAARLGDHDRDRLAEEADGVAREHRAAHGLGRRDRRRADREVLEVEVGGGVDADHAGHPGRLGRVDVPDARMREAGTHEHGVQGLRLAKVVCVWARAPQKRRILDAPHRGSVAFTRTIRSRHLALLVPTSTRAKVNVIRR